MKGFITLLAGLTMVLLLGACGKTTVVNPPTTDPRTISDTVTNWNLGAAALVARVELGEIEEIARGTIDANGVMDLQLPQTVPDRQLMDLTFAELDLPEECSNTVTITPSGVRGVGIMWLTAEQEDQGTVQGLAELAQVSTAAADQRIIGRFYATQPVRISGTCDDGYFPESFAIDAPQGWSFLEVTIGTDDAITYRTVSSTDIPWTFEASVP